MQKRIQSKIIPVNRLSDRTIAEMYALFEKYYVDVSPEQFRKDLFEKTHVFMFRNRKELIGFSTIFRRPIPAIGPGMFMFSGDTVIREDFWGSKFLQQAFFRYILQTKLRSPFRPVYWMLISKGFKTYLMMRKNFAHSFPSPGRETPAHARRILDHFYHWKFGDSYDPRSGLIQFENPQGAVRGMIADPDSKQKNDPHVVFFLERNPDYRKGTELACLAEIRYSDFLGHIPKYFSPFKRRKGK